MEYIQVINKEWIDLIFLDNINLVGHRKFNDDFGKFYFENDYFTIIWEKWGKESFKNINNENLYANTTTEYIEIFIEKNEWKDICKLYIYQKKIIRKYNNNDVGTFSFDKNDLIINWSNDSYEKFYQTNKNSEKYNGKYYVSYNIKNAALDNRIKMIAIVFPQFHEVEENNKFWGKGFTEWTLLKNIPKVVNGQIIKQPHDDIGYFNLNDYEHRKYMRILAQRFNIYGFCYYHYWFKNKKVMYEPLELMLKDGEPNKPYFFCWANEQWTKRWDGGNNEILISQDYTDVNGNIEHFYYLLDFFKTENYIKQNNKPIFIFYRLEEENIYEINNIIILWNKLAIENGFDGIHFMKFLGPFNNDIFLENIQGYAEFEPGYATQTYFNEIMSEDTNKIFEIYNDEAYLNKNSDILENGYEHYINSSEQERNFRTSKFFVYDGEILYDKILDLQRLYKEQHRGISLNWNNTPRRNYTGTDYGKYPHYYKNIDPKLFGKTLKKLFEKINNDKNNNTYGYETNNFLFISAWNEWNEQAILEPNKEDGYSYLLEVRKVYSEFYDIPIEKNILNISHLGGGTEKYMNDLKKIFINYNFINFDKYDVHINYDELYKNIDMIHINSILFNNLKNNYLYFFQTYFKNSAKIITIHDYQWLYPDKPNIIKENIFLFEHVNLNNFIELLKLCNTIIFPSKNIYNNYSNFIDLNVYNNKIIVLDHFDKIIDHNFLVIPKIDNNINIAFIGYYSDYKGSKLFNNLAIRIAEYKNYPIKYHIFGYIQKDIYINNVNQNIIIYDKYEDDDIINILHQNNIHGITHLSLFEETYCYALTNSINSGIPIFYMNRGSIGERLIEKNKYIPCELDNIYNRFYYFLEFIIGNHNNFIFNNLNSDLQPNRWYLENY
jgi:hypothetical protein